MNYYFFLHLASVLMETMAVESAIVLLMKMDTKWLLPCLLGNLLTNPLLNVTYSWLLYSMMVLPKTRMILVAMEIGAVLYEAFIYDGLTLCGKKEALKASLICNLSSFAFGVLVNVISQIHYGGADVFPL